MSDAVRTGAARPAGLGEFLLATLFFAALTVALTWPAATEWRRLIPVSPPSLDALHEYYAIGWGAHALVASPRDFFNAPYFYPYLATMAFMEHLFGLTLLALPIKLLTGSLTAAYNAVWLMTFVLSALGAYQLTRALTGSAAGALLAGVAYAFHPFRYHNAGQLNVLAMMWIPWGLYCLQLWLERGERRHLAGLALLGWLQFVSSAYAGIFLAYSAALLLALAPRSTTGRHAGLSVWRRLWAERGYLLALLLVVGALTAPFAWPYVQLSHMEGGLKRILKDTVLFSAAPLDFVTAAPGSLWRAAGGRAHHALFPGAVTLLLALAGILRSGRRERFGYGALALGGALMALGPRLLGVAPRIPLPFLLAWYVVPGVSFIRAPVRFVTLSSLGLAVLAGFGVAALVGRRGGAWRALAFAPALLAAVELCAAPVQRFDPLGGGVPRVYARIQALPPNAVLAELPMARDEYSETDADARYQLYGLTHGRRLVNGVAAYLPPKTRALRLGVQTFPDDASLAALRVLGVTHVLVHTDLLAPAAKAPLRAAVDAQRGLRLVDEVDGVWLIELAPG